MYTIPVRSAIIICHCVKITLESVVWDMLVLLCGTTFLALISIQTVANKFNKLFGNIGESLANEIPSIDRCPSEYIKVEISENFFIFAVTEDEIGKIICNFKVCAAGWGDLRPRIMKLIQSCIKRPLAHICNRSFMTGIFPSELKIANVVPIFKAGDDMVFSNYRPFSVLPVL